MRYQFESSSACVCDVGALIVSVCEIDSVSADVIGVPAKTVSVNCVVLVSPPFVPATVIGNEPFGVVEIAAIVSVLEKVGEPDVGLKEQEAPAGRSLVQDRVTVPAELVKRMAVIVFEPLLPCIIAIPPELIRKKSKLVCVAGTNSYGPMSAPLPWGRGLPSRSTDGASDVGIASIAGLPARSL